MATKQCSKCNEVKFMGDYYQYLTKKGMTYYNQCTSCHNIKYVSKPTGPALLDPTVEQQIQEQIATKRTLKSIAIEFGIKPSTFTYWVRKNLI